MKIFLATLVSIFIIQKFDNILIICMLIFFVICIFKKDAVNIITCIVTILLFRYVYSLGFNNIVHQIHSKFYSSFRNYIDSSFPYKYIDLITAMIIGTSELKLSQIYYTQLKNFNLLYVIAISGANFALIKNLMQLLCKFINKKKVFIAIIFTQTLYILLVGLSNITALRAYLVSVITLYASIVGRPIDYWSKTFLSLSIIAAMNVDNLTNQSLILSLLFGVIYKMLSIKPLNRIFDTELKRITLIFIVASIIFNVQNPDFIANLVFALLYPIIFVFTFVSYILFILNTQIYIFGQIVTILLSSIWGLMDQLSSSINTFGQDVAFIAILAKMFKSNIKRSKYEYKFAQ